MNRRGQAALEYIVTYGWGFIAILVVLGGLSYFGFLNPTKYLPERCDFGSQLECVDARLDASFATYNGRICAQFRNNFGEDIEIIDINTLEGTIGWKAWWNPATPGWEAWTTIPDVQAGSYSSLLIARLDSDPSVFLAEGDRVQVPVNVTFRRANPQGPPHSVIGEIFATVQSGACTPT